VIVINLLPQEERTEERVLTARPRARFLLPLLAGVALIVPPAATFVLQTARIQSLNESVSLLEQEAQSLKPRVELVRQIGSQTAALDQRLDVIRGLNRDRSLPVRMMDQLAAQVPANLWLTRFKQTSPRSVQLEGVTFSNLVVADLMSGLEETSLYDQVELVVASREALGEIDVTRFTLTAALTPQP